MEGGVEGEMGVDEGNEDDREKGREGLKIEKRECKIEGRGRYSDEGNGKERRGGR